jgi:hypothetical protein
MFIRVHLWLEKAARTGQRPQAQPPLPGGAPLLKAGQAGFGCAEVKRGGEATTYVSVETRKNKCDSGLRVRHGMNHAYVPE